MTTPAATHPTEIAESAWPSHARRVVWWLSVGYGLLLLWSFWGVSDSGLAYFLSEYLSYHPLFLAAAWALGLATLRSDGLHPANRRSLGLLTLTMIFWFLGNAGFTWTYAFNHEPVTPFSFGDGFFIVGDVLMIVALLTVPRRSPGRYPTLHAVIDLLIVLTGATVIFWDLIVAPTLMDADSLMLIVFRVVYPTLAVGYLASANWIRNSGGPVAGRETWRIVFWAVTAYAVAEGFYQLIDFNINAPDWYYRVDDLLYIGSYLAFQAAGHRALVPDGRASQQRSWHADSLTPLPIAAAMGVMILLVIRFGGSTAGDHWLIIAGFVAIVILLLVRQEVTAHENDRLIRATAQRKGEERAAALVRHSSDLVIMTDPDRTIRFASPSTRGLLGIFPEELSGSRLDSLIEPYDLARIDRELAASGSGTVTVIVQLNGPDGVAKEFELVINDLIGEPSVEGIILVGRDRSERRRIEERLRQSEKLEAVGKLAGGIAHDFNNILTTILAETELMLESYPEVGGLTTVQQAAEMGASLTRQLLTFARRQTAVTRSCEINSIVSSTIRMLGKLHGNINLDYRPIDQPCSAVFDPQQIRAVILNLLINARDAMPGGGTLSVELSRAHFDADPPGSLLPVGAGEYVCVTVADTGIGMEPEVLRRAFEPFFTTKGVGKGTGLGLPSVLGSLQQHAAGLWLDSTPGVGTRITFALPLHHQRSATTDQKPAEPSGGDGTILLVDDEEAVRDVTRRLLERLGYRVCAARSPEQARELLASGCQPDLVLTDVAMPGESGPQFVQQLRHRYPELKVLYSSGYPGADLKEGEDLSPDTGFISKPFTLIELAQAVHELLAKSPA